MGATSPPSPGHRAAAATPHPWHCPTVVPSLHPTVPRRAKLPPKARAEGWVPVQRAADHSQGPHRSALALSCAQKSSLLPKTLCRESCPAVLSVTGSPSENQQLLPIRSFGDRNSAAKKNLTRAGKASVPSSGKPREDLLQQNHMLERRNLWGEQMWEKSRPHGRGILELRELPPLGITHTSLWLLWGRGNPSHGRAGASGVLGAAPATASPHGSPVIRSSWPSL